jgi:prepilin-type processing-associated H-X9-DG protein
MGNLRQLAIGMNLFPSDNNDHYCPAGFENANFPSNQLSWDSWLNRYIGGSAQPTDLQKAITFGDGAVAILLCPADKFPKVQWLGGAQPDLAIRSYAMDAAGTQWQSGYQVPDASSTAGPRDYKLLPNLANTGGGVGIYWNDIVAGRPDWNAPGYPTSIVRDPSRNIILCENAEGQNCAQNIWTCVCIAPMAPGTTQNELCQICSNSPPQDPVTIGAPSQSQGMLLYRAHSYRFNYAFCDGHVQALKVEQTIGSGTLQQPRGMWTATGPY